MPRNGLEIASGANFECVLHLFSSLTHLMRSWRQLWPKTAPKQPKSEMIIFPSGVTATKFSGTSTMFRVKTRPMGPHSLSYFMLRNSASGPVIGLPGRITAGFQSGDPQNRPSGRPKAGEPILRFSRLESGRNTSPIRIRPKYNPAFLRNMGWCPNPQHFGRALP